MVPLKEKEKEELLMTKVEELFPHNTNDQLLHYSANFHHQVEDIVHFDIQMILRFDLYPRILEDIGN